MKCSTVKWWTLHDVSLQFFIKIPPLVSRSSLTRGVFLIIFRSPKIFGACGAENLIFGRFSTFEIFKIFWSEILSLTMGIFNKNCSEKTSAAHYTIQKHRGGFCSSVFWRYNFTKSKNGGMESGKIQSMYQIWLKIGSKCFKNNKKINLWIQNAQHFHLRRQ